MRIVGKMRMDLSDKRNNSRQGPDDPARCDPALQVIVPHDYQRLYDLKQKH
jgi:hypothetical protein